MTTLDPYLNEWDERFHALVAKNLIEAPWKPMLRVRPIFPYEHTAWCCNHIWLHKQPLFLWQMALSMKIFGVSLWSMRLPSALMGAILIFPIFRIGSLLHDEKTGYYGAFLSAFAFWQLEMVSGQQSMDHNDMAFLFYITLSLWAYFEREKSAKPDWRWAILIGVFAGAAVLCKWLTGLLVYSAWAYNGLFFKSEKRWKEFGAILLSIGVAAAVFLPWQVYIQFAFPQEASHERAAATKHIFEIIENHGGDWDFYVNWFRHQYGNGIWVAVFAGLLLCFHWAKTEAYRNALLIWITTVYVFFSLIAQTKLSGYVYIVSPLIYVLFGLVFRAVEWLMEGRVPKWVSVILVVAMLTSGAIATLQPEKIASIHFQPNNVSEQKRQQRKEANANVFRKLDTLVPPDYFVFNCPAPLEDIDAMFFSNRQVYSMTPNEADIQMLKSKGMRIAVFDHPDGWRAPDHLRNDPDILLIREKLLTE